MVLKRVGSFVKKFYLHNHLLQQQVSEIEWAHIYHDTIRGRRWLENLSISSGRWAANYSFLYILTRILSDYKPQTILEIGLGESSKLISCFLDNELRQSRHTILENSIDWINHCKSRFTLSERSKTVQLDLEVKTIHKNDYNGYKNIRSEIKEIFDLYVVDGPRGSKRFSRYDIYLLAEQLNINHEFIILIDDYDRQGEKDTSNELAILLKEKGLKIFKGVYIGNKSQIVLATKSFQYATSL